MEKRSTTMLGKTAVFTSLGVICTVLEIALMKDFYATEAIYSKIIFEGFVCTIVAIMALGFIFLSIECSEERRNIRFLKLTLNGDEYVPIQPKKKLPKDFQEFKKKFKKTNFLDFYTAKVKMDEFEQIHVRFKDKKGNITDQKIISATDFCRYFEVIE